MFKEYKVAITLMMCIFMVSMIILNRKIINDKNQIIEEQGNKIIQQEAELERNSKCGVYPFEKGYIIDGYYYEYKGAADIEIEGE